MDYNYKQTNLSKAIFGGLFAGLIACGAVQVYNLIFRYITDFEPAMMINVQTLIFAPLIFCVIAGIIYFMLVKFIKGGRIIFTTLFVIITVAGIFGAFSMKPSGVNLDVATIRQFRELLTAVIILIGGTAAFVLPYVTKHDVLSD